MRLFYSQVLVDVPCNTDRNVVLVDENNLFNPQRFNERVEMPNLQKNLLLYVCFINML